MLPVPPALGFGAPSAVETGGKAIGSCKAPRCSWRAGGLVLQVDKTLQYYSLTDSSSLLEILYGCPPT